MSTVSPALSSSASTGELRRATSLAPAQQPDSSEGVSTEEQSFSFSDFLSVINPLQHIPIVGSIYRAITGDTIKPAARVIGGMIFGGPVGLIASAFNAVVEQTKGKDLGDQAIALFMPDKNPAPSDPATLFAKADTSETSSDVAATAGPQAVPEEPTTASPLARPQLTRNAPPGLANAFSPERTLGGSFMRGQTSNGPANPPGRTLADYRSFSGRPLPVVDSTRAASGHAAPVRLQPTVPLADRGRVQPGATEPAAAREAAPAEAPAATAVEPATAPTAPAPASDWFTSAMSRGLDKYREQNRPTAPMRLDATL